MRVVFATPTLQEPYPEYFEAFEASVPALNREGKITSRGAVFEVGCTYISHARANLLRKALDDNADVIVFIDHDMSWEPDDLVKLITHPAQVVAGTYRYKRDPEEYMGAIYSNEQGTPLLLEDGTISAQYVPAGFLKVTKKAVQAFARAYPELLYGDATRPHIDLFNHGAIDFVWHGEDYAFAKRWRDMGNDFPILPDLNLTHHTKDKAYPGNFHKFLLKQPGGSDAPDHIEQLFS